MYFFGSDGGPLDWASYNAHVANLERDKEQVTPDVTLTVQWDKYKDAFATQVAKEKVMAEEDPDVAKDTSMAQKPVMAKPKVMATAASAAAAAAESEGTFV